MNTPMKISTLVAAALLVAVSAIRSGTPVDLKVGDPAPKFSAMDDTGKMWKSADHVGKKVMVVYFYPADFTGGCTKEACGYRDDYSKLTEKGVEVVGVSGDSVHGHELFKKYHELPFTLLADTDGKIAEAFGVPTEAGADTVMATNGDQKEPIYRSVTSDRWTFVIDKKGKIASKNTEVHAADDSKAILDMVEKMKK
ncbi:MAG TPA: peroxiredoxin [Candidatus Krumholzibacteria bacterium]|nr:peroxiredoxin [Candidatus Krumholzibacteria bacterium]